MVRQRTATAEYVIPICLTAFFLVLARYFLGLSLADNTVEIIHGEGVSGYSFLHYQVWSPLYSEWLHQLAHIAPDPLVRYFLSWGLIAAGLALMPTLTGMPWAWIYNILITVFPCLIVEPFIGQFGSLILVTALCVLLRRDRSIRFALVMACCVSFVVAFARSEFTYGLFLCVTVTLGLIVLESIRGEVGSSHDASQDALLPRVSIGLLVIFLAVVMLFVLRHSQSARSGIALSQHYNLRAVELGTLQPQGAFWNSDYAALAFGVDPQRVHNDTATIVDFLRANPPLFTRFVMGNLLQVKTLMMLACWCVVILWPWFRPKHRRLRPASLFVGLMGIPPFVGVLLISPRWHYMILVIPSMLLLMLQMFKPPRWLRPSIPVVLVSGCLLIWVVEMRIIPTLNPISAVERKDLWRVECMRAADHVQSGTEAAAFDATATGGTYLMRTRTLVTPAKLPDWGQFQLWATTAHPGWITSEDALLTQYHVSAAQMDALLQDRLQFKRQTCEGGDIVVYEHP